VSLCSKITLLPSAYKTTIKSVWQASYLHNECKLLYRFRAWGVWRLCNFYPELRRIVMPSDSQWNWS